MIFILGAALALAACQQPESSPGSRPAPASNAIPVSIDVSPPVWIEGDPLRVRLTVENPGPSALTVPAEWLRGEGVYVRQVAAGRQAAQGASAELTAVLATSWGPSLETSAGPEAVKLPAGSSLTFPVTFPAIEPPPGDAFDVFFLSRAPVAGTVAIRVERCENLRGALARVETDRGRITFALSPESAPLAVRNFVKLAESGFYDGIAFHRIVRGLCVQAGDPETRTGDLTTLQGTGGKTFNGLPIPLERTRAAFDKGTVGLARTPDLLYLNVRSALAQFYQVDTGEALDAKLRAEWPAALQLQECAKALTSGTSQFFICTASASHFVGRYAAFAKVVEGMDVVTAIEGSEVLGAKTDNPNLADRPVLPTRIVKITIDRMPSRSVKSK